MIKKTGSTRSPGKFIPYPAAMDLLSRTLADAPTPEELAVWIFLGTTKTEGNGLNACTNASELDPRTIGTESNGLNAYSNANELDPPPRFLFDPGMGDDYVAHLMGCWFRESDIQKFKAPDRYINWQTLLGRWERFVGVNVAAFVRAKIAESRLLDVHPVTGGTSATFPEFELFFPPLESGLFNLSQVKEIEASDFGVTQPVAERDAATQNQGVLASHISECFDFWDKSRWDNLLPKPPVWLKDARLGQVRHRKAAHWNPAMIATCLWGYREKYRVSEREALREHARLIPSKKQLYRMVREHFPDWAEELRFDLD